ncbi:SA1362 family protein [Lentibacillus sp. CBA3610]|uniref:SA1362 family protein n=1 Tax=Lentibacillus sp. CBA3610 TaxID=2518176 RepID=UPI0015954E2E|nr:SA1362 family protein [Lentibacillus sp. CBA3610]
MPKSKGTLVVYVIIGLAIIGVVTQLFSNTASFLTNILTMLGFGVAVFALLYFLVLRKRGPSNSNDAKKYKQAVKQSKAKYNQQQNKSATSSKSKRPQSFPLKKKSGKRPSHLRVIDGNKSKRKNRASF